MNEWWSYLLAGLALFVTWHVGRKRAWAWLVATVAQLLWIVYAVMTEQYGFLASSVAFLLINLRNYVKWRREECQEVATSEV